MHNSGERYGIEVLDLQGPHSTLLLMESRLFCQDVPGLVLKG